MTRDAVLPLVTAPRFLLAAAEDEVAAATPDDAPTDDGEYD